MQCTHRMCCTESIARQPTWETPGMTRTGQKLRVESTRARTSECPYTIAVAAHDGVSYLNIACHSAQQQPPDLSQNRAATPRILNGPRVTRRAVRATPGARAEWPAAGSTTRSRAHRCTAATITIPVRNAHTQAGSRCSPLLQRRERSACRHAHEHRGPV